MKITPFFSLLILLFLSSCSDASLGKPIEENDIYTIEKFIDKITTNFNVDHLENESNAIYLTFNYNVKNKRISGVIVEEIQSGTNEIIDNQVILSVAKNGVGQDEFLGETSSKFDKTSSMDIFPLSIVTCSVGTADEFSTECQSSRCVQDALGGCLDHVVCETVCKHTMLYIPQTHEIIIDFTLGI